MVDFDFVASRISSLYAIPIRVYRGEEEYKFYFSRPFPIDPVRLCLDRILSNPNHCFIYSDEHLWSYGAIKNGDTTLIIGPIGNLSLSEYERRRIYFELSQNDDGYREFWEAIDCIDSPSISIFSELLVLHNYYINGERLRYYELYAKEDRYHFEIKETEEDTQRKNTSYSFERKMIDLIKSGDVDGVKDYLLNNSYGNPGKSVADPLRQAKNYFCSIATLISREAINSGVDEEESLNLSDLYISKSELCFALDAVYGLMYQMVLDYTERIERFKKKGGEYSPLVKRAIRFMLDNLTDNVSSLDFALGEGISDSNFRLVFKRNTGLSFHQYFTKMKIDEAKRLLKTRKYQIVDVAYHLGFSSQSHFQNVFKSVAGITPRQFMTA